MLIERFSPVSLALQSTSVLYQRNGSGPLARYLQIMSSKPLYILSLSRNFFLADPNLVLFSARQASRESSRDEAENSRGLPS
jgi:hypothetical protein